MNKIQSDKKEYSQKFYKDRVEQKKNHIQENLEYLKILEKKEQEVFQRLKNTYGEQDKELKKMENVLNMSKQGFYKRTPASPIHNKCSVERKCGSAMRKDYNNLNSDQGTISESKQSNKSIIDIKKTQPDSKHQKQDQAEQNSKPADHKEEQKIEPKKELKVDHKTEPKIESKAEPKDEPKVEPKVEPKIEPKAEPKVEPKAEPKVEPKAETKTELKVEHKAESKTELKDESKVDIKEEQHKTDDKIETKEEKKDHKNSDASSMHKSEVKEDHPHHLETKEANHDVNGELKIDNNNKEQTAINHHEIQNDVIKHSEEAKQDNINAAS